MRSVYTISPSVRGRLQSAVAEYMRKYGFDERDKHVPPEMVTAIIDLLVMGGADLHKLTKKDRV